MQTMQATSETIMPTRTYFDWPQPKTLASYRINTKKINSNNHGTLPEDPRQWTRPQVEQWLAEVSKAHSIPEIPTGRFAMNGKALCLMTQAMFVARVPQGGQLLHKDFQLRLSIALHRNNNNNNASKKL